MRNCLPCCDLLSEDGQTDDEYDPTLVATFTAVLLKLSSNSLSHSFAALAKYFMKRMNEIIYFSRYVKTLRTVAHQHSDLQETILRTLYDTWYLHKQVHNIPDNCSQIIV